MSMFRQFASTMAQQVLLGLVSKAPSFAHLAPTVGALAQAVPEIAPLATQVGDLLAAVDQLDEQVGSALKAIPDEHRASLQATTGKAADHPLSQVLAAPTDRPLLAFVQALVARQPGSVGPSAPAATLSLM